MISKSTLPQEKAQTCLERNVLEILMLPIITIRKRKITELVDSLCISAENIMFFQV